MVLRMKSSGKRRNIFRGLDLNISIGFQTPGKPLTDSATKHHNNKHYVRSDRGKISPKQPYFNSELSEKGRSEMKGNFRRNRNRMIRTNEKQIFFSTKGDGKH